MILHPFLRRDQVSHPVHTRCPKPRAQVEHFREQRAPSAGSRIPAPMVAQIEFLEDAIGLQRRAFNFRRWVADAGATGRVFASRTLRHDCYVGGFSSSDRSPSFFHERERSTTDAHRSIRGLVSSLQYGAPVLRGAQPHAWHRKVWSCAHAARSVGHAAKNNMLPRSGCRSEPHSTV